MSPCLRYLLFLGFIALIVYCKPKSETKQKPVKEHFTIPKIINSQQYDSVFVAQAKWVTYNDPEFFGKFSFEKEEIDINPDQLLGYYDPLAWEKDYAMRFSTSDSIDYNGFDIIVDYDMDVFYHMRDNVFRKGDTLGKLAGTYYAVYVVNATNKTRLFNGENGGALGIQEAKERWNKNVGYSSFRPIEHKEPKWCGMGDWKLLVHPKEYIVLLFPKYKGEFKTQMRVRLEIGESTYVSRLFTGYVSEQQFKLHEYTIKNIKAAGGSIPGFYGASPDHHQWITKKVSIKQ